MSAVLNQKRLVFSCDACGSKLTKRTSYRMHKHLRHDVWRCDNDGCGACYVGSSELISVATPSGDPSAKPPELPPTKAYQRRLIKLSQMDASPADQQLDFVDAQERDVEMARVAREMREEGFSDDAIRDTLFNGLAAIAGEDDEGDAHASRC